MEKSCSVYLVDNFMSSAGEKNYLQFQYARVIFRETLNAISSRISTVVIIITYGWKNGEKKCRKVERKTWMTYERNAFRNLINLICK